MAIKYPLANGNWSNAANWNGGTKPVAGDDVYAGTFTVNVDENIDVASLNNSAAARPIATTTMTSNNSPVPYVVAASGESVGLEAYRAFNKVYTPGSGYWNSGQLAAWLSYDFTVGTVIDGYTIYGINIQANNPRNWTLEGSNNNVSWTVLHTVTLPAAILGSGLYSINTIGNSTSYRYYRLNISLGGGSNIAVTELELYQPNTAALSAGGGFNFNTAGVTATVGSIGVGASNLFTFSHSTGAVSVSVTNNIIYTSSANVTLISYSGNGDLVFTCPNISVSNINSAGQNNIIFISKTGAGTLTINSNLTFTGFSNGGNLFLINSSNGNIIVNGNIILNSVSGGQPASAVRQTAGTLNITGNLLYLGTYNVQNNVVSFQGTSLTINGNLLGGVGTTIATTANTTIVGNVFAPSVVNAISIASAITINVTGNVYGSPGTIAINSTAAASVINIIGDVYPWGVYSASGTVTLTGDMYNSLGRNAITSSLLYISDSTTTKWVMDLGGGATKTLYSADTFPNVPAITDVRNGITYGPALSLTGTMVVPAASDVRMDVPVDATVGTGELTSADIISGINASADPLAVRLRTILSDKTAGNLISQYNNS